MQNVNQEKLQETVAFIQAKIKAKPYAGIILGSGLGGLVHDIDVLSNLSFLLASLTSCPWCHMLEVA